MRIRTFQGLVPAPGREAEVAAVPYDVVNREEAAALVVDSPDNLLHVDRAAAALGRRVLQKPAQYQSSYLQFGYSGSYTPTHRTCGSGSFDPSP